MSQTRWRIYLEPIVVSLDLGAPPSVDGISTAEKSSSCRWFAIFCFLFLSFSFASLRAFRGIRVLSQSVALDVGSDVLLLLFRETVLQRSTYWKKKGNVMIREDAVFPVVRSKRVSPTRSYIVSIFIYFLYAFCVCNTECPQICGRNFGTSCLFHNTISIFSIV